MSVISWIRDLFGIRKDMYDTKRTRLEIKKLEDAQRDRLITPATLEDVEKYDPKTKRLMDALKIDGYSQIAKDYARKRPQKLLPKLITAFTAGLLLAFWLKRKR